MCRSINEKCRLLDLLFVLEFTKKQHGKLRCSCLKQPCMQDFVCVRIDRSVQPVTLIIDLNHSFVHRDVIRFGVAAGL